MDQSWEQVKLDPGDLFQLQGSWNSVTPILQDETEQRKEQHLGQTHCWGKDPGLVTPPCATVLFPGHTVFSFKYQFTGAGEVQLLC